MLNYLFVWFNLKYEMHYKIKPLMKISTVFTEFLLLGLKLPFVNVINPTASK